MFGQMVECLKQKTTSRKLRSFCETAKEERMADKKEHGKNYRTTKDSSFSALTFGKQ
jgi:hypothetical protein